MKDLFSEFDNDGSGQIDLDEFRYTIMTTMALNVTQAAVDALFVAWDVDGSGEIDVSEADSKKLEPLCSPPPARLLRCCSLPVPCTDLYIPC